MEVHINNAYLQHFISKHSDQSVSKVLKYLAILGIHFLETLKKQNITFQELKEFANSVIKVTSPQEKPIAQELKTIKEELALLSKRVEGKLGNVKENDEKKKENTLPPNVKNQTLAKNSSLPNKLDTKGPRQRPPSAWKENVKKIPEIQSTPETQGHSQVSNEKDIRPSANQPAARLSPAHRYIEWQEVGSLRSSQAEYQITPKPNEIVFTGVDFKASKSVITKHHLDDTETKSIMKEEGIVYFPNQAQNNSKGKENKQQSAKKSLPNKENQTTSPSFFEKKPQELSENFFAEWSNGADSTPHPVIRSKSPQFAKDIIFSGMLHSSEGKRSKEYLKPTLSSGQKVNKNQEEKNKLRNSTSHNSLKKNQPRFSYEKGARDSSLNRSSHSKQSEFKSKNKDFKHVESKIKDEINYHKELSKQYRKMKQSMGKLDSAEVEFTENLTPLSTKDNYDNFNKEENKRIICSNPFEESSRSRFSPYNRSQLMESTNSVQKSSLTTQQLSTRHGEKTPLHTTTNADYKKTENTWRSGSVNRYHNTEESRGGMLDIANNFLNSPLMQHLSNIDIKNLDTTMKDSIFNTNNKQQKTIDSVMFTAGPETVTDDQDEGLRLQQSYGGLQHSQNSRWKTRDFPNEFGSRNNTSILKDSTNKRFKDNMTKELGNIDNNEGPNSLASSNFSNFLNDEMKGFYQRETFDNKKQKNDIVANFGASINSSNMSFNGGPDLNREKSHVQAFYRKNENLGLQNNNQNYGGFSFDNANVFRNERMSVTQLLDN